MNPVIQLTVERGQHLTTAEMFMNAGIVILVVFGVLLLMYILISISGKIIQAITKVGSKEEKKAAPKKEKAAPKAEKVAEAIEETATELEKLVAANKAKKANKK